MACRVGITTDPETRRKEWETAYPDLTDWRLRAGCVAEAGAYGPESARWFVYYFKY